MLYSALLESVLALTVSCTGSVLPQLFPVHSRVIPGGLCCLALVLPDHAGRLGFVGFRRRSIPYRLEIPGTVPEVTKAPRKCATSQKQHQNPVGLNWENLKKNRRNLRLIQTCGFFILCIMYINSYNVPRRDVKFYLITFNSSFPVVFILLTISEILLLRLFCRLVSLFLRFADSLLTVPMPTPFRISLSCSGSVN